MNLAITALLVLAHVAVGSGVATPGDSSVQGQSPEASWNPPPGKYLLAVCLFGRLTNQIMCMRAYLQLAQVLNRTLLIPTTGLAINWHRAGIAYEFPWDVPVNWHRMQKCLAANHGLRRVMTTADYLELHGKDRVEVTFYQGLFRAQDPTSPRLREFRRINEPTLSLPPRSSIKTETLLSKFVGTGRVPSPADVIRAAGAIPDDIICLGEMFGFRMEPTPKAPRVSDKACSNLWRPHAAVMQFVQGAVDSQFGQRTQYAALHMRRGDFYEFRSLGGKLRGQELEQRGFSPIVEYARKVRSMLERANLTRLYIASNARKYELHLFKAIVLEPGAAFAVDKVLTLEDLLEKAQWLSRQKWASGALALEDLPGTNGLVLSLIDKFFCVTSTQFWGSEGSSFSREVSTMLRKDELSG